MTDSKRPIWGDTQRVETSFIRRTPAAGVSVPEPVLHELPEEVTGNYEGEALRAIRARRPTDQRIGRVEEKQDKFEEKQDKLEMVVSDLREDVGKMSGKLDILPELVSVLRNASERSSQRETITLTAQVDVDKAQKLDVLDARKMRRALIAKVIAAVVGAVVSVEVVHAILHRLGVL